MVSQVSGIRVMMVLASREFGSWPGHMQERGVWKTKSDLSVSRREALADLLVISPNSLLRYLTELHLHVEVASFGSR